MQANTSIIANRLVDCAASAKAKEAGKPPTPVVLKEYRESARAVTIALLQALLPVRKPGSDAVLEFPNLTRVTLGELITAVQNI